MKTSLWNAREISRAERLLQAVEADVRASLSRLDRAMEAARVARRAFERVKAADAPPRWTRLVWAEEDLREALADLARLVEEVRALNGSLAFDQGAGLRLSGLDEDGRPVLYDREGAATPLEDDVPARV
jgi:hypothetical protein